MAAVSSATPSPFAPKSFGLIVHNAVAVRTPCHEAGHQRRKAHRDTDAHEAVNLFIQIHVSNLPKLISSKAGIVAIGEWCVKGA